MGFLHVYTGNGKGKTTCAVGLAVRAAGAGLNVAFVQFDKGFDGQNEHYNERHILRTLPQVDVFPFGMERMMPDGKFRFQNIDDDFQQATAGLELTRQLITGDGAAGPSKSYQMIILDEIVTCIGTKLLTTDQVMDLVSTFKSGADLELIMTGRSAWPELIEAADLVTEMTLVKHYFYQHQPPPRPGIDY